MTPSGGLRSVGVSPSPTVTILSERLAPVYSPSAPRLSLAPSAVLLPAARTAVALPTRSVRLRDGICGSAPTIGSTPATR